MVDVERAQKLLSVLAEVIDHPLYDDSPRIGLSAILANTTLEFGNSTRTLCAENQLLGATVCLRSQFESFVRSIWIAHCATDAQIDRLNINQLTLETIQGAKNIPLANDMIEDMQAVPHLANLMVAINEFKDSSWRSLNSFVHSGLHAVIHTKFGWPESLIDQTFKISNGICVSAFTHLGILTGLPGIQAEIYRAASSFSSVLPAYRKDT